MDTSNSHQAGMTIFELIGEGDSVPKANINDRESVQVKHGSILLVTNPPG